MGLTNIGYTYQYNLANQRTRVTLADSTSWAYGYDNLGQVTSGRRSWQDGTPVAGQQFEYAFDDIGNRTGTAAGGDQGGAGLRPALYSANHLNQYESRQVPGAVDITGIANPTAAVTVNGSNAVRQGEYFVRNDPLDNYDLLGKLGIPTCGYGCIPPSGPPDGPKPSSPGPQYYGCDKALSGGDRSAIDSAIQAAPQRLQDAINGTISLPTGLTTKMASCILGQLNSGFGFSCAWPCSPLCWAADGFAIPHGNAIVLCVSKIKGQGGDPTKTIELLLFHEICHSCGKWGHSSPDGPYDWGAWLTTVLPTRR